MLEPGGEADLAKEALGAEAHGELGVEHLERDRAVVPEVAGEPDGGHAAAAELALERVAVPQAFAQHGYRVGHAALWLGEACKIRVRLELDQTRVTREIPTSSATHGELEVREADRANLASNSARCVRLSLSLTPSRSTT